MERSTPNNKNSAKLFLDYYNDKLNDNEKHQLEKAALEDPFLDDALEGFRFDDNAIHSLEKISNAINKRNKEKNNGFWYNIRPFYPHMAVAATIFVLAFSAYFVLIRSFKDEHVAKVNIESQKTDTPIQLSDNKGTPEKPVEKIKTQEKKNELVEKNINHTTIDNANQIDKVKNIPVIENAIPQSGNGVSQKDEEKHNNSFSATEDVRQVEPAVVLKKESVIPTAKVISNDSEIDNQIQQVQTTMVENSKRRTTKAAASMSNLKFEKNTNLETYLKTNPFQCYDESNSLLHGQASISYKTDKNGSPMKIRIENISHENCSESVKDYIKRIPMLEKNQTNRQTITINY